MYLAMVCRAARFSGSPFVMADFSSPELGFRVQGVGVRFYRGTSPIKNAPP